MDADSTTHTGSQGRRGIGALISGAAVAVTLLIALSEGVRDDRQIETAVGRGLRYVLLAQDVDGLFPAPEALDPAVASGDQRALVSVEIAHRLRSFADRPVVLAAAERAAVAAAVTAEAAPIDAVPQPDGDWSLLAAAAAVQHAATGCGTDSPATVDGLVESLLGWQKRDGGWPAAEWPAGALAGWGSRTLTTVVVVEALDAWQRCLRSAG